ncbi:Protein of unknown function [Pyronema omphalodes CBS 100304]|uniref:Uncharacterized protein n=1 Tax=Pyronema omphalodes (strain CBS 100304) TaxID=1076935 RepID=U4L136_PYROM|nr:Protein of unknown function [Pyronema omphalodes CBS 100304]
MKGNSMPFPNSDYDSAESLNKF